MTAETKRAARTLYFIRQIQLHSRSAIDAVLRPFELTAGQYMALSLLGYRDGLSSAQLSRRIGVTPQSLTMIISALEGRQLISRRETPGNRRILRAQLTRAGLQLLAACETLVDRVEADLFGGLTRAEITDLRRLLSKVVDKLRGEGSGETGLLHEERQDAP